MLEIVGLTEGYTGREWKRDEKHRVYVVGPVGEVGYLDLKSGKFIISPKASINFGVCEESDASIKLVAKGGSNIYLGQLKETPIQNIATGDARKRLQNAIKDFNSITSNAEKTRVEINIGPTVEFRIKGRSHWAKANLTLSVDNGKEPLDIEKVYDATSEMVSAMLEIEVDKLGA
tara:strand:+ start:7199 stop:7723 length:525 start_codon:yes stop_codon:yes gene_type:complete